MSNSWDEEIDYERTQRDSEIDWSRRYNTTGFNDHPLSKEESDRQYRGYRNHETYCRFISYCTLIGFPLAVFISYCLFGLSSRLLGLELSVVLLPLFVITEGWVLTWISAKILFGFFPMAAYKFLKFMYHADDLMPPIP
jgi:hypothetical protein